LASLHRLLTRGSQNWILRPATGQLNTRYKFAPSLCAKNARGARVSGLFWPFPFTNYGIHLILR